MVNIKKMVKLVKKGMFYCNAFPVGTDDEDYYYPDDEGNEQQEYTEPLGPTSGAPIVEQKDAITDAYLSMSPNLLSLMGDWASSNAKLSDPSDVSSNPTLYSELIKKPLYKKILSNKFFDVKKKVDPILNDEADQFVSTIIDKNLLNLTIKTSACKEKICSLKFVLLQQPTTNLNT